MPTWSKLLLLTDATTAATANKLVLRDGSGKVYAGAASFTGDVALTQHLYLADSKHLYFGTSGDLDLYHDGSNSYIVDGGTGDLILQSGGSTTLTLDNSQNATFAGEVYVGGAVGHGTSKFQVLGTTTSSLGDPQAAIYGGIAVGNYSTLGFGHIQGNPSPDYFESPAEIGWLCKESGGGGYGNLIFATRNSVSGNPSVRMTIESGGYVGIGETDPAASLSVRGAVGIGSATYTGTTPPSNSLIVSGNIGINDTSPSDRLNVGGNAAVTGTVTWSGGGSSESNSAYDDTSTATNANTASKIVKRDASGNFSAGTITATLTGTASGNSTGAHLGLGTASTQALRGDHANQAYNGGSTRCPNSASTVIHESELSSSISSTSTTVAANSAAARTAYNIGNHSHSYATRGSLNLDTDDDVTFSVFTSSSSITCKTANIVHSSNVLKIGYGNSDYMSIAGDQTTMLLHTVGVNLTLKSADRLTLSGDNNTILATNGSAWTATVNDHLVNKLYVDNIINQSNNADFADISCEGIDIESGNDGLRFDDGDMIDGYINSNSMSGAASNKLASSSSIKAYADLKAATGTAVSFTSVNTGYGANELRGMNQDVKDDSNVRFLSLGVGRAGSGTDGECVIEKCLYVGNGSATYAQDEIRCEGEVTAYYGSDIAMKKNLTPISNPLDKVLSLSGYDFKWKAKVLKDRGGEDGFFVREKDVGIIAQEVEKVCPEIVATRQDGNKAVRYEKLVPLLIESIKELTAKVTRLENGTT